MGSGSCIKHNPDCSLLHFVDFSYMYMADFFLTDVMLLCKMVCYCTQKSPFSTSCMLERSEFYQNSENIEHQTGYIHLSIRRPYDRDCKLGDLVSKGWILYFKEGYEIHKPTYCSVHQYPISLANFRSSFNPFSTAIVMSTLLSRQLL